MSYQIIANYQCQCGEGPLWHPDERRIYWQDIPTGRLFKYDPVTSEHACVYHDRPIGGFTIQADGKLLLFRDKGNVVTFHDGKVIDTILEEIPDEVGTRFNDVIADPMGRVFCGTMPVGEGKHQGPRPGRLYRLDPDGSLHLLLEGIGVSNGMAFILDSDNTPIGMYYTDTPTGNIYRFDYDIDTGQLTNQRVHIHIAKDENAGAPDGMTVDIFGHIYTALWGGWGVRHYDPQGRLAETLKLPAKCITSCIFGPPPVAPPTTLAGPNADALTCLYITSAMAHQPDHGRHAGATFMVNNLNTQGLPDYRSRIGAA